MNKCGCRDAGSILKSLTAREVWLHNDEDFEGGTAVAYRKKQLGLTGRFLPRVVGLENKEKSRSVSYSPRTKSFDNPFGGYSRVSRFSKSIPKKVSEGKFLVFLMRASSLCRMQ